MRVGSGPQAPVVSCDERTGGAQFPGARVLLGVISVPTEFRPEAASPTGESAWKFAAEIDLDVRADRPPVVISVPESWRKRAAISVGKTTNVPSLEISSCPNYGLPRNAFTGAVSLETRTACVPLIFKVGPETATVRFGIGERCPPGA